LSGRSLAGDATGAYIETACCHVAAMEMNMKTLAAIMIVTCLCACSSMGMGDSSGSSGVNGQSGLQHNEQNDIYFGS
jgi:hypothetical protein